MQICVLEGTNTGACRRVVSGLSATTVCNKTQAAHFLCPERNFTFDKPFPSPLDETSLVSIMPFVGHMAFNGNDYSESQNDGICNEGSRDKQLDDAGSDRDHAHFAWTAVSTP